MSAMNAFAALADPTRQQIVQLLAAEPLSSGAIAGRFAISAPAISQHLKILRKANLVAVKTAAQQRIYTLNMDGVNEIANWLEHIRGFWNQRLDALENALLNDLSGGSDDTTDR